MANDDGNGEFKGQMKAFVDFHERQRAEDKKIEKERHEEVMNLIKENKKVFDEVALKVHDNTKFRKSVTKWFASLWSFVLGIIGWLIKNEISR